MTIGYRDNCVFPSDGGVNMSDYQDFTASVNCQACGSEHLETDLKTVKLSSLGTIMVCESCASKTAEAAFNDAADLLDEIVVIARATGMNPERRLRQIKSLIGG